MNFIVAATTDKGLIKSTNQDSYNVRVYNTKQGRMVFAVLCDGMGGLEKGEVASASLVKGFCKWADTRLPLLSEFPLVDADIRADWDNIVTSYNEKIKAYASCCGIRMGTTVTVMLLTESRYYILNVGDTRAYEITQNICVLTKDQTAVAREVELGNITEEEAQNDVRRSVLLQCVGASEVVYPDMFFGTTKWNAVYMLCSDGFRHEITGEEIHQWLHPDRMTDADGMKQNLDFLVQLNKQRQERDNISAISIRTF